MADLKVKETADTAAAFLSIPFPEIWSYYDREAGALYLNFKRPSQADDSELTDDDLIVGYDAGEVVGIAVLHASKRALKLAR
jgi:uncharacterized protein YuzE